MKNKKFLLKTFHSTIPIDEAEVVLVMQAVASGEVKLLKRGIFNPSTFDSIVEDSETMSRFREDKKYEIREGKITEYPAYDDLFPALREEIKRVGSTLQIKNKN